MSDADDEELEDRLVEDYQNKQRPLNLDEASRLSRRGGLEAHNLSSSVLSGVLS